MQATIEIDLGPLADEWEAVAYRPPRRGERYAIASEKVVLSTVDGINGESYLIVRRKWAWPAGVKAAAMAMDADGQWWIHEHKPHVNRNCWDSEGDVMSCHAWAFDLPECGDWRQSLRENPNWRSDNGQKDT